MTYYTAYVIWRTQATDFFVQKYIDTEYIKLSWDCRHKKCSDDCYGFVHYIASNDVHSIEQNQWYDYMIT